METDVRVPISRGVRVGTKASRARRKLPNVRSRSGSRLLVDMRSFFWCRRLRRGCCRRDRQLRRRESCDVLGEGRQVVRDAPRELDSVRRKLNPTNKLGRRRVTDRDIRAEALVYRGLDFGMHRSRKLEGAAHEHDPSWDSVKNPRSALPSTT